MHGVHIFQLAGHPVTTGRFAFSGRHYNQPTILGQRTYIMRLGPALARRIPLLVLLALAAPSVPAVPLQVYGQLPHLEEMAVSPDGSLIAFVKTEGNAR